MLARKRTVLVAEGAAKGALSTASPMALPGEGKRNWKPQFILPRICCVINASKTMQPRFAPLNGSQPSRICPMVARGPELNASEIVPP